jgi:thymidylate synthase (FAD)
MIVHNSVNEYSTRYSIAIDEAAITSWMDWRAQSKKNKQGSDTVAGDMEWPEGFLEQEDLPENYQAAIGAGMTPGEYLSHREQEFLSIAREVYEERLEFGIAREQARKDLPLSTFTQAYWKIDLHNLLHFLGLRRNPHAQKEIRDYAVTIGNVFVKEWCPLAWQAYLDYRENALYLSRMEVQLLQIIAAGGQLHQILEAAESFGWLKRGTSGKLLKNRERSECEAKLVRLGFQIPWSNTDG